jgi:ATP-dependent Clp protease protease subunit
VTALSTEGALDRWNPAVRAASESEPSISIYEVIGEDPWTGGGVTVKRIDAALRAIGNKDVIVNINSPGGDVFEGIAIYNRLREHQGQITVKVLGLAASAASVIAMAGDNVQIGASSFLMIHNAWVLAIGNRHDMREVADFLEPFDRALADVYVARSGQKLETCRRRWTPRPGSTAARRSSSAMPTRCSPPTRSRRPTSPRPKATRSRRSAASRRR